MFGKPKLDAPYYHRISAPHGAGANTPWHGKDIAPLNQLNRWWDIVLDVSGEEVTVVLEQDGKKIGFSEPFDQFLSDNLLTKLLLVS